MSAKKVLFITQEITPYVPESNLALIGQNLPQAIQDKGRNQNIHAEMGHRERTQKPIA